jgi:gas vesicle protein
MHDLAQPRQESMYQRGKDMIQETKDMYNERVDQASNVAQNVKETGESIMDRVKHTGERILHPMGGASITEEAKQMACYRAQQATDMACQGVDMRLVQVRKQHDAAGP